MSMEVCTPVTVLAQADHRALPAADVLEALVYIADPKAECREIAEQALQTFGSLGAVLSAQIPELTTNLRMRRDIAYTLKAIHRCMCSALKESICERVPIGSLGQLVEYLGISLRSETVEVLRVLYLDSRNRLISDEEAMRGTVDHLPVYPREIVRRALELGASAAIMAHNHPSEDPTPSEADVRFSQQVDQALRIMNIILHDSLIIGRHGAASLRHLGKLQTRPGATDSEKGSGS